MLKAKILNSQATLNNYVILGSLEFVPGEEVKVVAQIINSQLDIRYIPDAAATMDMIFVDKDGNEVIKTASVLDADDRSIWTVTLTPAESLTIVSQNIKIVLDDNGTTMIASVRNGLARTIIDGDC
jgi:hypothetical protein